MTLPLEALGHYLEQNVPDMGQLGEVKQFSGGQSNPTHLLTTSTGQFVLRQRPLGKLLPSAHAIDREYRLLRALRDTAVPVADAIYYCADEEIIGAQFYLMRYVEGDVHWDASLKEAPQTDREAITLRMVETLAAIHSVDWRGVGLGDFGKPTNYAQRQIDRWTRQYEASAVDEDPAMLRLIEWLRASVPADDGQTSLVHGDFRIDNLIYQRGTSKVAAVLDWELSTIGHPMADLAYILMHHRLPNDGPFHGLAGIDRAAYALPGQEKLIAAYCELTGIAQPKHLPFWISLAAFRLTAVLEGVRARIESGNAADAERGRRLVATIPVLLDVALEAADLRAN